MPDLNPALADFVANVVGLYINMFGAVMADGVVGHLFSGGIVRVNVHGAGERTTKLSEEVAKPDSLTSSMRYRKVFGLGGGLGYDGLTTDFP